MLAPCSSRRNSPRTSSGVPSTNIRRNTLAGSLSCGIGTPFSFQESDWLQTELSARQGSLVSLPTCLAAT